MYVCVKKILFRNHIGSILMKLNQPKNLLLGLKAGILFFKGERLVFQQYLLIMNQLASISFHC